MADYAGQLAIVAVPSNLFRLQQPGTNPEVALCYRYVRPGNNFVYTFDLAAKVDVNGENEDPLYTYLKDSCPATMELIGDPADFYWSPIRGTDITWNFEKFLVDTAGNVIKRYEPDIDPDLLRPDIDAVLAGAKAKKTKAEKAVAKKPHRQSHLPRKN